MPPLVSFVIATHNRSEVVIETLSEIRKCGLRPEQYEIIVVDSASTDDTPERIARESDVQLLALQANLGSVAKAYGVDIARGHYIVFLDDDSFPRAGSIERMVQYFAEEPQLGAAGFRVELPDGREECCAWQDVPVGCGVGFRREALQQTGGLDRTFFMQAEEYDLTFRLTQLAWQVRVMPDLWVQHQKTPLARVSQRTTRLDVRNNLRVLARYLPDAPLPFYIEDCLQRYLWLAVRDGNPTIVEQSVAEANQLLSWERQRYRAWRMTPENFELQFGWQRIEHRCLEFAAMGVKKIALAGLGKNLYAFFRGAEIANLSVTGVIADGLAAENRFYRGIPVINQADLDPKTEMVIISDSSFVRARQLERILSQAGLSVVNDTIHPQDSCLEAVAT